MHVMPAKLHSPRRAILTYTHTHFGLIPTRQQYAAVLDAAYFRCLDICICTLSQRQQLPFQQHMNPSELQEGRIIKITVGARQAKPTTHFRVISTQASRVHFR